MVFFPKNRGNFKAFIGEGSQAFMAKELDLRTNFKDNKVTESRQNDLTKLAKDISEELPGNHNINIEKYDATTGNPAEIASKSAPADKGNYINRALQYLQTIKSALGLKASQPAEFQMDPHVQVTSSQAKTVHAQQLSQGLLVFQAATTVRFGPNDAITGVTGNTITIGQDLEISPKLSAKAAVIKAAQYVVQPGPEEQKAKDQFGEPLIHETVDLSGFEPRIAGVSQGDPSTTTFFESGPFADRIRASMLWFAIKPPTDVRLAWEVVITMPNYAGQYRTIVDAKNGEILYNHQLIQTLKATMNVYRSSGGKEREMVNTPLHMEDYDLPIPNDLPREFPDDWVEQSLAIGNCAYAHLGNSPPPPCEGTKQGNIVIFDPQDANGDEQKVLNIFYFNCYMHDYFYLLGFKEADGNFQVDNFGRGGSQNDRVDARAHSGTVNGTANMATPVDGIRPIMNMGLVSRTNRHTAFDSDVVYHEFMHGVTNRLVGGRVDGRALESPQSGGMGEGWGDYVACTINKKNVVGDWVVNNTTGIRGHPYDSNFPDNFGDLGKGRYNEVHNIGEIWCATLCELNRNIGEKLGMQLVVDALKLSQTNPSFLNMRDSILRALDDKLTAPTNPMDANEHKKVQNSIWSAFAKFGMGPNARSSGAQLWGIEADFNPPPPPPP
jgi:extracellular elastinolytic metalloproteinase